MNKVRTKSKQRNIYLTKMADVNDLYPEEWIFHQGMLFGSYAKWWGDHGIRLTRHEGLDIGLYRDFQGQMCWISPNTLVPAIQSGRVINICKDFLGKSVIVEHERDYSRGVCAAWIYAHIIPNAKIKIGGLIRTDDIIGNTADTKDKKSKIPAHLHISFMLMAQALPQGLLNWDLFATPRPRGIYLFNPLSVFPI